MIAFLSHEASRTGAPTMFLHLIRWFKINHKEPFIILIKKDGPLSEEFRKQAKTIIINNKIISLWGIRLYKIFGPAILYAKLHVLLLILKIKKVRLIYSNSITNGKITHFFSRHGFRIITHVHELEHAIAQYGESNLNAVLKSTDHYIAASIAVKENLSSNYNIPIELIDLVYECIDNKEKIKYTGTERVKALADIGIDDPNAFITGGCGVLDFRKATEIFILAAYETITHNPDKPFYFIWVGADINDYLYSWLSSDIEKLGLKGKVFILPSVADPFVYYKLFDLFLLTSREDPFPLVCLENALMHTPVLCFEKAGGMSEFVANEAGCVIKYLDITETANKIELLYKDKELLMKLGSNGSEKARKNYTINVIAPQIEKIIDKVLTSN